MCENSIANISQTQKKLSKWGNITACKLLQSAYYLKYQKSEHKIFNLSYREILRIGWCLLRRLCFL